LIDYMGSISESEEGEIINEIIKGYDAEKNRGLSILKNKNGD